MANEGRNGRSDAAKRIPERLREGFGAYEIAGQEKPTERRVRQIVAEAVEGREALESAVHAVGAPIRRENRASGHSRRLKP